MTNELGKMIKAMRKQKKMTQLELSKLCGLERTSITNIEAGKQVLNTNSINAIADALGYRVKIKFEKKL